MIKQLVDFTDPFSDISPYLVDTGFITTLTRGKLSSTQNTDPQMRLWSGQVDCQTRAASFNIFDTNVCAFGGGQYTLANMSWLNDPFWSELPSGFSTGLIRQFAPRINSTATRETITEDDFPLNCDQAPGGLYIHYANTTIDPAAQNSTTYSVDVCMPANMSVTPWRPVHHRQDFSEEMYLKINLSGYDSLGIWSGVYYSKVTLNTTGGYFELPNYMNGQVVGPLLEDDPSNYCGLDCEPQGDNGDNGSPNYQIYDHNITDLPTRALSNEADGAATNATAALYYNLYKGPLLTTALALFGVGSFIETIQGLQGYLSSLNNGDLLDGQCIDVVPFVALLRDLDGNHLVNNPLDPCVYVDSQDDINNLVANYLWLFVHNQIEEFGGVGEESVNERIQNAFTAAAFLANEAFLAGGSFSERSLTVNYDMGADTEIPRISLPGLILISALLCIFLSCLLAMAIYSTWIPRWSSQLDSFAMMRIGATMADKLPLRVASHAGDVRVLDEMPGWIGDATGGEGSVGELAVGAESPLRKDRMYRYYQVDRDKKRE